MGSSGYLVSGFLGFPGFPSVQKFSLGFRVPGFPSFRRLLVFPWLLGYLVPWVPGFPWFLFSFGSVVSLGSGSVGTKVSEVSWFRVSRGSVASPGNNAFPLRGVTD